MTLAQATDSTTAGEAALSLAFIFGMVGLLVGGGVALIVLWYVRGRDPAVTPFAEYVPEPPDDLPPGAAGTLLDEKVDHEDVVATLIGLGRHGAIRIHEVPVDQGQRRPSSDFDLELVDSSQTASRLESDLLVVLFGRTAEPGAHVRLREVKARFDAHEPTIRHDLYQEMVDRGYFLTAPDVTRRRWRILSWCGLAASVAVGMLLVWIAGPLALVPMFAAVVVWIIMIRMSNAMPQKTVAGAEAAAQWRAFRTYLASIDRYEDLAEARGIFDKYLSFAIAFGLQKQWLDAFTSAGAAVPAWFDGPTFGDIASWNAFDIAWASAQVGRVAGEGGGDLSLPDVDLSGLGKVDLSGLGDVDIQGAADALAGGLGAASGGLASLLDIAGSVFESIDFDL